MHATRAQVTGVQLRIAGKLTDATPVEGTPPADSKADLKCKTTYATKWSGATELPGRHPGDRSAAVVPVEVLGGFRDAAGSEGAARTASEDSARSSHLAVWAPAVRQVSVFCAFVGPWWIRVLGCLSYRYDGLVGVWDSISRLHVQATTK